MRKLIWLAVLLALLLAACGGTEAPADTAPAEAPATEVTTEATEPETEPAPSLAERMEEVRPLYYGTAEQIPDRAAAVAILEELQEQDDPEVNYLLALEAYRRKNYEKALPLCERAVEQDYDLARVLLGEMYLYGTTATPKDAEKAEALFQQAVANGCADGYVGLGDIQHSGAFGRKDSLQAVEYYNTACREGSDPYWIADAYLSHGTAARITYTAFGDEIWDAFVYLPNFEASVENYEKAAELWNWDAMYLLVYLYTKGINLSYLSLDGEPVDGHTEPNPEKAAEWAEKLIAYGEQVNLPEVCQLCGSLYRNGYGVAQDYGAALDWFRKGADLGNASSMFDIAMYYYYGYGVVEVDPITEIEWNLKAADAGSTTAMRNLGVSYQFGSSVEKDEEKALEWYEKAAALGDTESMLQIAYYYREQDDPEKELEWYEKAAANGSAEAMNYIGVSYHNQSEYEKAEEWYIKAAHMQYARSMTNLSKLYNVYNRLIPGNPYVTKEADTAEIAWHMGDDSAMEYLGRSFERQIFYAADRDMAIKFYRLAAALGNTKAIESLERLGVPYNP